MLSQAQVALNPPDRFSEPRPERRGPSRTERAEHRAEQDDDCYRRTAPETVCVNILQTLRLRLPNAFARVSYWKDYRVEDKPGQTGATTTVEIIYMIGCTVSGQYISQASGKLTPICDAIDILCKRAEAIENEVARKEGTDQIDRFDGRDHNDQEGGR